MSKDLLNIGLFVDDLKTKAAQIRRQELRIYGNCITIHTAWRVCERIKRDLYGDEEKSFQKIPGLLLAMQLGQTPQRREETHHFCEYKLDIYAGQFVRCWILPQATKKAFLHYRKFVTIDSTFTKSRYRLTLLVISTADGNRNALPLAWALVNRENEEN